MSRAHMRVHKLEAEKALILEPWNKPKIVQSQNYVREQVELVHTPKAATEEEQFLIKLTAWDKWWLAGHKIGW